jgi:hypothetical protein
LDDNDSWTNPIEEGKVGWVLFEVAVVLALAIAIVWWTFPKKPRRGDARAREDGPGPDAH